MHIQKLPEQSCMHRQDNVYVGVEGRKHIGDISDSLTATLKGEVTWNLLDQIQENHHKQKENWQEIKTNNCAKKWANVKNL